MNQTQNEMIEHYQCNECHAIVAQDQDCKCGAESYTEVYQCEECGEYSERLYEGRCPQCFAEAMQEAADILQTNQTFYR